MEEQNKKKTWKPRPRYMGKITKFYRDKGYGFIVSDYDGESYFFHISQFVDDLPERGMIVNFMINTNKETGKQYCSNCLVVEYPPDKRRNRKY